MNDAIPTPSVLTSDPTNKADNDAGAQASNVSEPVTDTTDQSETPSGPPSDNGSVDSGASELAPEERPYDDHAVNVNSGKSQSNITDPSGPDYVGPPETVDKNFTYPTHTDPQRHIDGHGYGIYLDDVQRQRAELQRAQIEDREPDLVNPPAVQGTPLVPTGEVRKNLPGDYVVEPDVSLPVVVGVSDENLTGYGDAVHARKVAEEHEAANKPAEDEVTEEEQTA